MLGNFISVLQFNNISIERKTLKLFDFKTKELYNLYRMEMFLIITKNKKTKDTFNVKDSLYV